MKIDSGTIYFVRETDRETGGLSDLVKIGLVSDPKSPYLRLKEHQTGNPRKLVFDSNQFVHTSAVEYVEWLIHKTFASERVSGEWFLLPSAKDVERVVAKAQEIALEISSEIPLIQKADHLGEVISTDEYLVSTPEIEVKAWDLAIYNKQTSLLGTLRTKTLGSYKKIVAEAGTDAVKDLAKLVQVSPKPKFSPALFIEKYPDIALQFMRTEPEFKSSKVKIQKTAKESDLPESFQEFKSKVEEINVSAISDENYYLINENLVQIDQVLASISWPQRVLEAELKVFCGTAAGVTDVFEWKRAVEESKPELSEGEIFEKHKSKFEECIIKADDYEYYKPLAYKA
jgi:hypothetical protein